MVCLFNILTSKNGRTEIDAMHYDGRFVSPNDPMLKVFTCLLFTLIFNFSEMFKTYYSYSKGKKKIVYNKLKSIFSFNDIC